MPSIIPLITPIYAGLLGLLFLALSFRVVGFRRKLKAGIGDGGDRAMARAIRVHANFTEYVPMALVMLLLLELMGASGSMLHGFGAALFIARMLHAIGLSGKEGYSLPRFTGALATFVIIMALAVILLVRAISW